MAVNVAPIKWAQRSDSLYLTIALPDVKDEIIQLTDQELKFKGKSQDKEYEVNIEFYEGVDSEGSTYKVLPRNIQMHVMKKQSKKDDGGSAFWPRLLKDKAKEKNQVQIDWNRYVEEDEEEAGFDTSALEGGMGMGGMGGGGMDMEALMKQMGGLGGADDDGDDVDDGGDDDDLPELEEAK